MNDGFSFGAKRMQAGDTDHRYRLSILLVSEVRPKYWDFHCVKCTRKVCELSGNVLSISDASDISTLPDYQPAPLSMECKGKWCRIWYEFLTLSGD